uniref:START domain-containing protein 10 n=1 Tax=Sus scrofa TaxID=9823 RepID=A0A8D1X4C7_PIG
MAFPLRLLDILYRVRMAGSGLAQGLCTGKMSRTSRACVCVHTCVRVCAAAVTQGCLCVPGFHRASCVLSGNSAWGTWCAQASAPASGFLHETAAACGCVGLSQTVSVMDPGQPRPRPQRADSGSQTGLAGPWKVASASAAASTLSEPLRSTQESWTRTRALGLPMEKSAASTEPQGPRPVLGRDSVQVPDDQDFRSFRSECEAEAGWNLTYSKAGVSVWVQAMEMDRTLHKIKCRMECRDVPAETLYDVLHDIEYRKKWDSNVIETFDIARLTVNADVGYYSWRCPKPLKNRDVITLRSWLPMGTDYIIMNYSVKHPKYPPRKDLVRAVSIQTGYLIQSTGPKSCVITYLAQVDPKGSLPKWVVNKSSQFLAPKAMKKMYKACVKYPEWKQKHQPHFKPWLHPEQSPLPSLALSELSVQHADSLENIDESAVAESREERAGGAGGEGSDDDTSLT